MSAPAYGRPPDTHRLPEDTRLGPVWLRVADLERSLRFYRDRVGFAVREAAGDEAWLTDAAGTPVLILRERRGANPVPPQGRLGLFHVAVLLPDRAALGRFLGHAARGGLRPGAADHAVSEALYLQDPDGLGLEVYADRPRTAWRVDGEELHVTTEPLDAPGLLAAGEGRPWRGMPAGTRVGHVHFHVGALDAALGFYHRGLGFDQTVGRYPGAVFLGAGGYHHHVAVNVWAPDALPGGPDDAGLEAWSLQLPDQAALSAFHRGARAAGLAPREEAGGLEVRDPWGIRVRVSAGTGIPGADG